ncbi:MAG: DUF3095 domain-containing protein [Phototrophicaceae bacterium]
MSNKTFFHDMPAMQSLKQITDISQYQDIPSDWLIAITDVRESTKAIEAGRYKAVNTMAAVTITAVLNSIPNIEVPFLFGGDGASIVVPPDVSNEVYHALAAVKRLGRENFELEVRAGIVPVADVIADGYSVKAGKVNVSENFQQPVFTGGGLDYADSLIKNPKTSHLYLIDDDFAGEADFSGFECRWDKHPASKGEVLSLLVKATANSETENNSIYDHVLEAITDIYGDAEERHPINYDKMIVSRNPRQYHNELGWKQGNVSFMDVLKLMFWSIGGYIVWKYVDKIWDKYRSVVRNTTDHEKFDDMLRMTISGTAEQRAKLIEFLEIYHQVGDLAYGFHTADHSLMTCIVFDRFGRQVHFLDADAGGYAMAAKQLKLHLQMKAPTVKFAQAG